MRASGQGMKGRGTSWNADKRVNALTLFLAG